MMDGHQTALWNHTSAVMSLIANVNRGKNTKAFSPRDFHPYNLETEEKKTPDDSQAGFQLLKQLAGGSEIAEVRIEGGYEGGIISRKEEDGDDAIEGRPPKDDALRRLRPTRGQVDDQGLEE